MTYTCTFHWPVWISIYFKTLCNLLH